MRWHRRSRTRSAMRPIRTIRARKTTKRVVYPEAIAYWTARAAKGDAHAAYRLGVEYMDGKVVKRDFGKALHYHLQAAKSGNPMSMFDVGSIHEYGYGVAKDIAQAALWYGRSANYGLAQGQYNFATMLEAGEGVAKDEVEAYKFFILAARGGFTGVPYNNQTLRIDRNAPLPTQLLERKLSREQLADGRQRADELQGGERAAQVRMTEWTNWSGWVQAQPRESFRPKSESEIVAAVRDGAAPVRVVGSGHSFTALGQTNGTADLARRVSRRGGGEREGFDRDGAGGQQDPCAGAAAVRCGRGFEEPGRYRPAGDRRRGRHRHARHRADAGQSVGGGEIVSLGGGGRSGARLLADVERRRLGGGARFVRIAGRDERDHARRAQGLQTARTQLADAGRRVLARSCEVARRSPAFRVLLVSLCRRRRRQIARRHG